MIEIHDLALDAPDARRLFAGLDLVVPRGGNQLVTGPSGSGKSRLLKVVAGTEQPARGRVSVGGVAVWPGSGAFALMGKVRVGFAFATGGLLSNLSLWDNVALPLRFSGVPAEALQGRVDGALERLGLAAVAGLRPHAVSASARKHGNLARVLAYDPDLILLDDPIEGLDRSDRDVALGLIQEWALDPAKTLLMAQEQPDPFAQLASGQLDLQALSVPLETP